MQFVCKLGTPAGQVIEEVMEASDEAALKQDLTNQGYHLFEIRRRGWLGRLQLPSLSSRNQKISPRDLLIFNQELAALLRSGLPMLQALELMLSRQRNPVFKQILTQVRDQVRSGEDLSAAIAAYGDRFPSLYSATLKAGERSGEMEQVIRRFVRHLKLVLETRKRVTSALVYPAALVGLSLCLIAVMTVYVLPNFTGFFRTLNVELPLVTRVTMGISIFVKEHVLIITVVLVVGTLAFLQYSRSETGRLRLSKLALQIPFLGDLFHRLALSEFCRSLATLLAGGIPLVSSMEVSVNAVSNLHLRSQLHPTIESVREGKALADTLEQTGAAPEILVDMVEVGEATGSLDSMLSDVSDFLDEEVDTRLQRVLSLLEPVMLVLMGIIIATLLISVYLPLFSLLGSVQS